MTIKKSHMRLRLTPLSMTTDDIQVRIISVFRGISQILEATTAKRMKIRIVSGGIAAH